MMTSNKPYIIRALYDWILDNNYTPYIMVDATLPFIVVPKQFIDNGKIVLNILPTAVNSLIMGNEWITFSARFSGVPEDISIPIGAIVAIFAHENAQGMGFEAEALPEDYFENKPLKKKSRTSEVSLNLIQDKADETEKDDDVSKSSENSGKKPTLTIIK